MKGEKIITQPWLRQSWRNFIWTFWRFDGQFDAWSQDYFDKIWCLNICQAKLYSFLFKLPEFCFSISRLWRLRDKNFFFIGETEQKKLRLECSVLPEPTVHIWNKLNSALWPKMGHISRLWLITTEDSPIINVLKNNRDLWKLEQD